MTSDAVVIKNLPDAMAEVAVTRGTACGSNCGNCEACIYANELHTVAYNKINASPGQHVIIETKNAPIFKAEFFVYILPLVLMIIGYLVPSKFGLGEGVCVIISFLMLAVSAVILVISQKDKREIEHVISRFKEVEE